VFGSALRVVAPPDPLPQGIPGKTLLILCQEFKMAIVKDSDQ
jgi:hypothetical protein